MENISEKITADYAEFKDELYALHTEALSDIVSTALFRNGIVVTNAIEEEMSSYIGNVVEKAFLLGFTVSSIPLSPQK